MKRLIRDSEVTKKRLAREVCVIMMSLSLFCLWNLFTFESSNCYSYNTDESDLPTIGLSHVVSKRNSTENTTANESILETKRGPKPYVVCTYLRGNSPKYIIGTIVLMESVRNYTLGETFNPATTPEIKTAVVCHESVQNSTRIILEMLGHDVIIVQDVEFDDSSIPNNRFKTLIQKYVVFELTQYQTALFIDSDAFVLKPQELRGIFGLLDEEPSQIKGPNVKPANTKWSVAHLNDIPNSYDNTNKNIPAMKAKQVMMAPDYGPDHFNSGVILYKPSNTLFQDFREFLAKVILPLPQNKRSRMTRSTQRLLQEFCFSPSSHYDLYNLCGETPPQACTWKGCYCDVHVYPQLHDCNKDKSFLQDSAIIAHFAGTAIDYGTLGDLRTSPLNLEEIIENYFAKSRTIVRGSNSKAHYDFECHRPILQKTRDHYSSALHRIGI